MKVVILSKLCECGNEGELDFTCPNQVMDTWMPPLQNGTRPIG